MKTINRTKCPTIILNRFMKAAGDLAGCRIDGVVIRWTQSRRLRPGASALECKNSKILNWDIGVPRSKPYEYLATDLGILMMKLPGVSRGMQELHKMYPETEAVVEWISIATDLFSTTCHECGHMKDYQAGGRRTLSWSTGRRQNPYSRGRRPNWADRPEEKRACACELDAMQRITKKEAAIIGDLAIWLHSRYGIGQLSSTT